MAGGFRPIQDVSGGSYTGKIQTFAVAAGHSTLLSVGDLVRITGTANTDGLAEVDAAAAAQTITGPIVATAATASGGLVNSNMTVNTSSVGAATAQIRIEGLKDGDTSSGATMFVRINESTLGVVGV